MYNLFGDSAFAPAVDGLRDRSATCGRLAGPLVRLSRKRAGAKPACGLTPDLNAPLVGDLLRNIHRRGRRNVPELRAGRKLIRRRQF